MNSIQIDHLEGVVAEALAAWHHATDPVERERVWNAYDVALQALCAVTPYIDVELELPDPAMPAWYWARFPNRQTATWGITPSSHVGTKQ